MHEATASEQQRVRVWFGEFAIVDRSTTSADAQAFATAMRRRFASLPVTIDAANDERNRL
ncbi:hypothetical protein GCM10029976_032030 [Kribbella albertanoniae]|uniref:Uncharacterized protein n=1 Tax=Kribbella albertanoniae TaxID=1266829 RepID=A0A4V2XST3_9ACTN|nr:hypothetical protein [Kribbella albertanoniae]TDC34985.1 hypothetical protein E1261_02050 [Kribbella albertanoniae]